MPVSNVTRGMIVASTHKQDIQRNHNQRRAVLSVREYEQYAGYGLPNRKVRKAALSGGGAQGGMTTYVTVRDGDTLSGYTLVSAPDPHIEALVACFEGIDSADGWERKRSPVGDRIFRALVAQRAPDGSPRPKEDVTLDQEAVRLIAERLFTLTQVVEQGALATFDSPAAGYAPAQPAMQAVEDLSERVDAILAAMPAQWGDGEPSGPVPDDDA